MSSPVLNALNTRLDAASIAFMLDHGEAKALIVPDTEFSTVIGAALKRAEARPLIIDYDDRDYEGPRRTAGRPRLRGALVAVRDEAYEHTGAGRRMRMQASRSTTPRATGDPKEVVYHHRGRDLPRRQQHPRWRSPHICISGQCRCSIATAGAFPGRSAREGGACMSACARCAQADLRPLRRAQGDPHCAARRSSLGSILLDARHDGQPLPPSRFPTAAAPPPARRAQGDGRNRPAPALRSDEDLRAGWVSDWKDEMECARSRRPAHLKARQGVRYHARSRRSTSLDYASTQPVPAPADKRWAK